MRALVVGGTGLLGREIVAALTRRGIEAIALSRRKPETDGPWCMGDLISGEGLAAACSAVDVVVHSANVSPTERGSVRATANLIDAAQRAGVPHLVFVGISGIDGLGWFPYYGAKLDEERLLATSGLPHSIVRAAQFHEFVAAIFKGLDRGLLLRVPDPVALRPIAGAAVAERVAEIAASAPLDGLTDVVGPETRSLFELAQDWRRARRRWRVLRRVKPSTPLFLAFAGLTLPQGPGVGPTWQQWLGGKAEQRSERGHDLGR